MSPVVSVVVATHNYARFLAESVASALAQDWSDLEVLIVDDGSTDDTAAVVARLQSDPRVRSLAQPRRGPAAARNRALAEASGKYVAMLDADDAWLPEKIGRQIAVLEKTPQVGLVYTNNFVVSSAPAGGATRRLHFAATSGHRPYTGWVLPRLARSNYLTTSTVVVRRAVLEQVGGYDESLHVCEDWDLWLRIAARFRFDYVDAPLAWVRRHGGNTHLTAGTNVRDSFRVLERIPRYAGGWAGLGRGVRAHAYAEAHLRAATSLYMAGDARRALSHIGRAITRDPVSVSRSELRLAVRCLTCLARRGWRSGNTDFVSRSNGDTLKEIACDGAARCE